MKIGSRIEEKDPINAHSEEDASEGCDKVRSWWGVQFQGIHAGSRARELLSKEVGPAEYQTNA